MVKDSDKTVYFTDPTLGTVSSLLSMAHSFLNFKFNVRGGA